MLEARLCAPCSRRCKRCHSRDPEGCDECFFFHSLKPDGGGCELSLLHLGGAIGAAALALGLLLPWGRRHSLLQRSIPHLFLPPSLSWPIVIAVVVAIFLSLSLSLPHSFLGAGGVTLLLLAVNRCRRPSHLSSHSEYLLSVAGESQAPPYPSGRWRGYYTQQGSQHGVCEFMLSFDEAGELQGEGSDDVGKYTIRGRHTGGFVAFSKEYIGGSHSAAGVLREENLGHTVEYRGKPARRLADGSPSLGGGIKGNWTIQHDRVRCEGEWHLWPVMTSWGRTGPGEADAAGEGESECCVCIDKPIDTVLEPCGHVALCSGCAARLSPRRCPLCRVPIERTRTTQAHVSEQSNH